MQIFYAKFVDNLKKMLIIDFRMDKKNCKMAAGCQWRSDIAGKTVVVGAKQLRKSLQNGRASRVFLAKNADPAMTEPIEAMCLQNQICYAWVPSMLELGNACGIDVGAAAAAVID